MVSRRRFLRGTTALAVVGVIPGCSDQNGASDIDGNATDGTPTADNSPEADDASVGEQVSAYERAIHERINEIRRRNDLGTLEFNEEIAAVARQHSADMAERDYFAHESPGGEGPADRLSEFFPEHCRQIGENIANVGLRPDDDPEAVAERIVSGWMDSPGHRENILREGFDEEGIGVVITDDDRVLATQNFCATNAAGG